MFYKLIKKFYNEGIEDFCTRLLYFFNTIDSFFIFAGFLGAFLCAAGNYSIQWFIIFGIITIFAILISDFHPLFIGLSLPHVFFLFYLLDKELSFMRLFQRKLKNNLFPILLGHNWWMRNCKGKGKTYKILTSVGTTVGRRVKVGLGWRLRCRSLSVIIYIL